MHCNMSVLTMCEGQRWIFNVPTIILWHTRPFKFRSQSGRSSNIGLKACWSFFVSLAQPGLDLLTMWSTAQAASNCATLTHWHATWQSVPYHPVCHKLPIIAAIVNNRPCVLLADSKGILVVSHGSLIASSFIVRNMVQMLALVGVDLGNEETLLYSQWRKTLLVGNRWN